MKNVVPTWLKGVAAFMAVVYAFLLLGCATSQPASDKETPVLEQSAPAFDKQTGLSLSKPAPPSPGLSIYQRELDSAQLKDIHVPQSTHVADIHVGDKPGILQRIFSTPAGSARRQARKDDAAKVPKKLGKGAVYAPAAKEVLYAWKADGTVTLASDSATVQVAGGNAANIPGNGNTLEQTDNDTTEEAPGPLATVLDNLTGPLGYTLAGLLFVGLIAAVKYRRRLPVIGPLFA